MNRVLKIWDVFAIIGIGFFGTQLFDGACRLVRVIKAKGLKIKT